MRFKTPWILSLGNEEACGVLMLGEPELFFVHWIRENGRPRSRPCCGERCEWCNRPLPEAPDKAWYGPALIGNKVKIGHGETARRVLEEIDALCCPKERAVIWFNAERIGSMPVEKSGLFFVAYKPAATSKGFTIRQNVLGRTFPEMPAFDVRPTLAQVWRVPMSFFEMPQQDGAEQVPDVIPFRRQA